MVYGLRWWWSLPTCLVFLWYLALYWHLERESVNPIKSFAEWANFPSVSSEGRSWDPLELKLRSADSPDRLFWFVQLSDIHVDCSGHGLGALHLETFLNKTLPMVSPLFVIVTGDITHAKDKAGLGSRQYEKEWEHYRQLLESFGVYDRADFWFDLRGNHDCSDVPGWESPQNLFSVYSRMKSSSYSQVFELEFGKYGIIAIDGCPEFGPSRPFNFFGALTSQKMDLLESHMDRMKKNNVRHTFLISHYPIVTMQFELSSRGTNFAQISQGITAYFSGHLHRLVGNLGRSMYARQSTGFLDLELNDLRDHRAFRIFAVDNDVVSFVDTEIDRPLIVLVTNPVDARFLVPKHEDVTMGLRSSHIRVLIFSKYDHVSGFASVDDGAEVSLTRIKGKVPLYTAPWDPSSLGPGLHKLLVVAKDSAGNVEITRLSFSVDGTDDKIGSFGEWLSIFRLGVWVKRLYWISYLLLVSLIILPTFNLQYLTLRGEWEKWRYEWIKRVRHDRFYLHHAKLSEYLYKMPLWTIRSLWLRLCLLANNPIAFWTFFLSTVYFPCGPLFVAKLGSTDTRLSALFSWGIWRHDFGWTRFLDTWTFSTFILATQMIPSYLIATIFLTGREIYSTPLCHPSPSVGSADTIIYSLTISPYHTRLWFKILVLLWYNICVFKFSTIVRTYGLSALVLGFGYAWQFIISSLLIGHGIIYRSSQFKFVDKDS